MVELATFAVLVLTMLVVGAIFWRHPASRWFEQRLPLFFPSGMVRNMEAIAVERPLNHLVMDFLGLLGGFALARDLGGFDPSLGFKYGTVLITAGFSLVMRRRSAAQREDLHAT
jgi:hypothetical protein